MGLCLLTFLPLPVSVFAAAPFRHAAALHTCEGELHAYCSLIGEYCKPLQA